MSNKFKFTVATVRSRSKPPSPDERTASGQPVRQHVYWDAATPGPGLVVRPPRNGEAVNASFIFMKERPRKYAHVLRKRIYKHTIGRFGTWTIDQAREFAAELCVRIQRGEEPIDQPEEDRAQQVTLRDAVEWHLSSMRKRGSTKRSTGTIESEVERYLPDWLDRPLAQITPDDCCRRHDRLTEKSGPYAANRAMRHLRACWNTAAKRHDSLTRNPVRAVTFNRERRRREPIAWSELPGWWKEVHKLPPIRRDLWLFVLFTGLSSTDAKTVRSLRPSADSAQILWPRRAASALSKRSRPATL